MKMENTHHIVVCLEWSNLNLEKLKEHPGVELCLADGAEEADKQTDNALMNNFHNPITLAFIGGVLAKDFAKQCGGKWIEDTPATYDELLRYWESEMDVQNLPFDHRRQSCYRK